MPTPGVGAWSVPRAYRLAAPLIGKEGGRVGYAVEGIQRALDRQGFKLGAPDGVFGSKTRAAVQAFQHAHELQPDAICGPTTAKAIFSPFADDMERRYGIPDRILHGQVGLESAWDPGAEGATDNEDRGLCQINRRFFPEVTDQLAYGRSRYVLDWSAKRLRDTYDGLKVDSWDPAIASHNSPKWGLEWARSGEPPNEQIAKYVGLVRKQAGP